MSPETKEKLKEAVSQLMTKEAFNKAPPASPNNAIKIASFNIEVFGEKKVHEAPVVDVLVKICRHFDIIAVQEVRSVQDNVLPLFVQALNADGSHYNFVIGPRLGRTNSKEQYAFIFDTDTIEVDRNQLYRWKIRTTCCTASSGRCQGFVDCRPIKPLRSSWSTSTRTPTKLPEMTLDDTFYAIRDKDGVVEDDVIPR
jgi:hypothetical protein